MEYGGNSHFATSGTVYASNPQGVLAAIQNLNLTILRDNGGVTSVKLIKSAGLRVVAIANTVNAAKSLLAASVVPDFIEGPNEWNNTKYGATPAAQASTIKAIWAGIVAARDAYNASTGVYVPLIAPSLSLGDVAGAKACAAAIGALPGVDFVNVHAYPGDADKTAYAAKLQLGLQIAQQLAPGKPAVLTEFGSWYSDGVQVMPTGHTPTPPADAIAYYPEWLEDIAVAGFVIAFQYEVACEASHQVPSGNDQYPTLEGWFGILDKNLGDRQWTPTIRALASAYNAPPPPSPVPGPQPPLPAPDPQIALLQQQLDAANAQLSTVQSQLATTQAQLADAQTHLTAANTKISSAMSVLSPTA